MRALIVGLAVGVASAASAQPAAIIDDGLVWRAPPSCPGAADVAARIARRLDGGTRGSLVGLVVDIAPGPEGFVARIDLRGVTVANEVRVLTSRRCDALTDAVAVVIARIAAERAEAVPRDARETRPRVEGLAVRVARSEAAPRTWGIGVRATALSGIGALPGVGVGGELAGYAWRGEMFAEVSAGRWMESSTVLADTRGSEVTRLDITTVRLGWRSARLPLRGWLGGELGSARDAAMDRRWSAIDGGFGVAWAMARKARLVGTIELGVPVARFRIGDGAYMYRAERITARSGLGLEVGW